MNFKVKGIITAISEVKATKLGTAVRQLHLEPENGKIFYPTALGTKVDLLDDLLPGDVAEIEFHISGSKGTYNNVIIDSILRI